ncbi:vacuolar protein sorting 37A [Lycorma delicatula]|uniref:vacuolar protein sorting 37A n=1 Tax=Lycorma delicatula TaxID=130591 RepID=UPI003F5121ED
MLNIYRDSDDKSVIRKRQIDTLKIFNANVSEIQEDVEYKVEFLSGGKPFALIIKLCPEFPLEKPVLKIAPPVSHQWVSESGEITSAPGLLNFTVYSDLGRVVQAIVREFELRPPPLLSDNSSPPSCGQQDVGSSGAPLSPSSYASYSSTPPGGSFRDYATQQVINSSQSVMFPELNSMPLSELQKLNTSIDRIDEFLESTPAIRELNRTREDWITRVEEISKENLSKEPLFRQLIKDIEERQEVFSQLKNQFEALNAKYQKLADRYSPQSIRESLQAAVVKSDERSEQIAEQFLNGEMDLDTFLVVYGQGRMLSHCRKTKEEKLSHQLLELQKAGF